MKPIIFSTPMVQAILAGKKTQTRRVIKQFKNRKPHYYFGPNEDETHEFMLGDYLPEGIFIDWLESIKPPYKPGDILWVRETWRIGAWQEEGCLIAVDYKADNHARQEWIKVDAPEKFERYWQQSTDDALKAEVPTGEEGKFYWEPGQSPTRWQSPIHMPKEVARIFLRVTEVWAERLQNITEQDAAAEGVGDPYEYQDPTYYEQRSMEDLEINMSAFAGLWDSLNAKRGYAWETNPWVWVAEFERIEPEVAE